MKTVTANFKSSITELCNNCLSTADNNPNNAECQIIEDALENVDLIINLSAVDHVENLKNDENVEYICHVSASSNSILIFAP
jgi:hypothetical protein